MASHPVDLQRFIDAQEPVYDDVRDELASGRKTSHWIWFVFPQLRVLGRSGTAKRFGIADLAEAQAYAAHPLLGQRLRDCARQVLQVQGRSVHQIFGSPDDLKLCSCMTLFERAAPGEPVFAEVLERCYGGQRDRLTLEALEATG